MAKRRTILDDAVFGRAVEDGFCIVDAIEISRMMREDGATYAKACDVVRVYAEGRRQFYAALSW